MINQQHPGYILDPQTVEALARVLDTLPMGTVVPGMELNVRFLRNQLDHSRHEQDQARMRESLAAQAFKPEQSKGEPPKVSPMPSKH